MKTTQTIYVREEAPTSSFVPDIRLVYTDEEGAEHQFVVKNAITAFEALEFVSRALTSWFGDYVSPSALEVR